MNFTMFASNQQAKQDQMSNNTARVNCEETESFLSQGKVSRALR